MISRQVSRPLALLEALFVSIVWASSFVIVKIALVELGPLTIGGLRYFIGFACLLPFLRRRSFLFAHSQWLRIVFLGLSAYTLGNGAMFWALRFFACHYCIFPDESDNTRHLARRSSLVTRNTQPFANYWYFDIVGGHGDVL